MLKISLCQINPWVGHLSYNLEKIKKEYLACAKEGVDLVVFPECATTGYPLEDLVLKPHFMERVQAIVEDFAAITASQNTGVILGCPWLEHGRIINTALFIHDGKIKQIISKYALPNYGVFDEKRVFDHGPLPTPLIYKGFNIGVMVCEDMWVPEPALHLKQKGADFLLVINGSPFDLGKDDQRKELARARINETGLPLIYLNFVGGQDSLVFDGRSFILNEKGETVCELAAFCEAVETITISKQNEKCIISSSSNTLREGIDSLLYRALVLGLRDYVEKNNFGGVLLGLSGGIDSAISAAIAVDALGPDRVSCVMMPSPYTSKESFEDAEAIVKALNVEYDIVSIEPAMTAYSNMLSKKFEGKTPDITEENIQSRARGMVLMALSNKSGWMVLSTGNKSEVAVGYATLYGDMCGGYNALKDVYKTQVFALSKWRNENFHPDFLGPDGKVMPERVITKPPSAELRPDQKDQDSLPEYEVLDAILYGLIEEDASIEEIAKKGLPEKEIKRVLKMLDKAEYKRRQSAPGPKITEKALSVERRYPITNGFMLNL
ncbi:MAG: NAD+ synthase [Alphaproteobacteria bacterium]|nr:NAD+ synthase [Alphaproteobacteria bacterium]